MKNINLTILLLFSILQTFAQQEFLVFPNNDRFITGLQSGYKTANVFEKFWRF